MASLVNLKRRLRVARNIAKTTRAMQMVAASKMRRAQESAVRGKPYIERLTSIVQNLTERVEVDSIHPFLLPRDKQPTEGQNLIIVFSPDKGLCGALISNLKRELLSSQDFNNAAYITVGRKVAPVITGRILAAFSMGLARPSFELIPPLAKIMTEGFLKNEWSQVFVLYAKFVSIFSQKPTIEKVLPIEMEKVEKEEQSKKILYYLFEPNIKEIIESLLPHYLEGKLYQLLLEAYASEQAARMMAMQNATENAKEIIDFLTLEYNKARQAKITNEILDVIRASPG